MTVGIDVDEDSSGTTHYAVLGDTAGETGGTPEWRARIWLPPPGVGEDVGRRLDCSVSFHPESRRPVAIPYGRGVLWVVAGSGAGKRLLNG